MTIKLKINKYAVFLSIAVCFLIFAYQASAIGQITKPIEINNALRGGEYEDRLTLINSASQKVLVRIIPEGQIKDWAFFYENNIAISSTTIDAVSKKTIKIIFKIPDGTSNGHYLGYISINKEAAEEDKSTSTVAITEKISRAVSIKITDIENISFTTAVIPEKYDLSAGENLKLRVIYNNTGNIIIKPQVEIKIIQAEKIAYNMIFPYAQDAGVRPSSQTELQNIIIPLNNLAPGKARAEVIITNNNIQFYKESIKFSTSIERNNSAIKTNISKLRSNATLISGLLAFVFFIFMTVFVYFVKYKTLNRAK